MEQVMDWFLWFYPYLDWGYDGFPGVGLLMMVSTFLISGFLIWWPNIYLERHIDEIVWLCKKPNQLELVQALRFMLALFLLVYLWASIYGLFILFFSKSQPA